MLEPSSAAAAEPPVRGRPSKPLLLVVEVDVEPELSAVDCRGTNAVPVRVTGRARPDETNATRMMAAERMFFCGTREVRDRRIIET